MYGYLLKASAFTNSKLYNYDSAIEDLEELLSLSTTPDEVVLNQLANYYKMTAKYDLAEKYYFETVKHFPEDEIVYSTLAGMYITLKQYEKAIVILNKNPSANRFEDDYFRYAQAYFYLNEIQLAKSNIDIYFNTETMGDNLTAHAIAAKIYYALKDKKKSCDYIKKADEILIRNNYRDFFNNLPDKAKSLEITRQRIAEFDEIEKLIAQFCN